MNDRPPKYPEHYNIRNSSFAEDVEQLQKAVAKLQIGITAFCGDKVIRVLSDVLGDADPDVTIDHKLKAADIALRYTVGSKTMHAVKAEEAIEVQADIIEPGQALAEAQQLRSHYSRLTDEEFAEAYPDRYAEWKRLVEMAK